MAYQSFTNQLINDKHFDDLKLPPKAPTTNKHKPIDNEGREILFHARNVLKSDENPSLLFLEDKQVLGPTNSPNINIHDLAHATDSTFETKMKRMQANRVYSARYRNKKVAMLQSLENQAKSLEAKISMIQYQLLDWGSVRDKLVEENTKMKARCNAASMVIAEKEAETWALMQELQNLRNNV